MAKIIQQQIRSCLLPAQPSFMMQFPHEGSIMARLP